MNLTLLNINGIFFYQLVYTIRLCGVNLYDCYLLCKPTVLQVPTAWTGIGAMRIAHHHPNLTTFLCGELGSAWRIRVSPLFLPSTFGSIWYIYKYIPYRVAEQESDLHRSIDEVLLSELCHPWTICYFVNKTAWGHNWSLIFTYFNSPQ